MAVTIRGSGQLAVQIVSATKTDTFASSAASWTDITGMTVTITPTNSSNKVFVEVAMAGCSTQYAAHIRLVRNGTAICIGDANGSRERSSCAGPFGDGNTLRQASISFLDSPATTSAVVYKLQYYAGGSTAYINRSITWSDNNDYTTTASTITATEMAYA
jgi:hypothetical protein